MATETYMSRPRSTAIPILASTASPQSAARMAYLRRGPTIGRLTLRVSRQEAR